MRLTFPPTLIGKLKRKTVSSGEMEPPSPGLPRKQSNDITDLIPGMEGAEAFFKTECQKETLHPVWNEEFHMQVFFTLIFFSSNLSLIVDSFCSSKSSV